MGEITCSMRQVQAQVKFVSPAKFESGSNCYFSIFLSLLSCYSHLQNNMSIIDKKINCLGDNIFHYQSLQPLLP